MHSCGSRHASHGFGAHTDGAGYRSAFRSQGDGSSTRRTAARETGLDWDADPEDALSELASG